MSFWWESFDFPPLGKTGEGPVLHRGKNRDLYWQSETDPRFYVELQTDHPAVAFRCYYPNGSAPCDQKTALEYISYMRQHLNEN